MLLVVGATGDFGARVVRRLVGEGKGVRCLVRAGTASTALPDGVVRVMGDLTDEASLAAACTDVGTVVCSATAIGRLLAGVRGPSIDAVDRDGVLSLVGAAERSGVARFVYVSYASPDDNQGSPIEQAKIAVEHRLGASPMRVSVVRPDAYHEVHLTPVGRFDLRTGRVGVLGAGDSPRRWVSTEDAAALTAHVALDPDPPGLVEFGGPEALTRNQVIDLAERLTGRQLRRQRVPRPVLRLGVRALRRRRPEIASLFGLGLMTDLAPARWDDGPLRERGIEPRSTSDFITEQARALGA